MIKLSQPMSSASHIWYPGMHMQDFETIPPLQVTHAQGDYIYTPQGKVIDAISSWWCKPLGHRHPAVTKALETQLAAFEHVMPAYATYDNLHVLGAHLSRLTKLPYALFASDGSSAVEMALKLTLHARFLQHAPHKRSFLALRNDYHGETLGTLSVSDLGLYKNPYASHTFSSHFIDVSSPASALYEKLEAIKPELNAFIFEPLIQGANGMRCYNPDLLKKLMQWAKANGIYCIADEIMTGFCRTGAWFACDHIQETPDILCAGKGLTNGTIPMSVTMVSQALYDIFYSAKDGFIHSHTHSINALGVAAACASIEALEHAHINEKAQALEKKLQAAFSYLQDKTGLLENIRGIGGIIAADLPFQPGMHLYQEALSRGALLRPIGKTLYWFPPLNIAEETLEELTQITYESLRGLGSRSKIKGSTCIA